MRENEDFSVFRRLFLIYTLFIVSVYVVLVIVFLNNLNQSTNEVVESRTEKTESFLNNLEQQLDTIYRHEINLANSSNVSKLAYSIYADNYEKTQLVLEQLRIIEGIQSMSPLIEDLIISYPGQSFSISTINGYEKKTDPEWNYIQKGSEYNYLITWDGKIMMNFSYPLMYSVSAEYIPDFNIQIVLSGDQLAGSLDAFSDDRENGAAIVFDFEHKIITESGTENIVGRYFSDSDMENNIRRDFQFISSESMKYPFSVVAFIDRQAVRRIKVKYLTILTVVMVMLSSIYTFSLVYTKRIIIKPLRELMAAFGRIQDGDFDVRIFHEPHDEFNYLYHSFNNSVSYIQKLIADIYEQENLIQNAELAQLQSQINPHFLYNSFFIINRMAKNEAYDQITRFVTSLARYYRFINKESKNFIPLKDEIAHMKNYIDIQQMRFSDKIAVKQEPLPDDIKEVTVPKLILQPLIENAYNYGLADKLEAGLIRITFKSDNSSVEISVEDNGDSADDVLIGQMRNQLTDNHNNGENHALFNIHKRLSLAYGNQYGLSVNQSSLGGIQVILKICRTKTL